MNEEKRNFGLENLYTPENAQGHQFVDIHCHCLPGIDDGPVTMEQAIALCRLLARDRIGTVVATPHQLGQFDRNNDGRKIKDKVSELNRQLQADEIPLNVLAGGDVRIDERIVELIKAGEVMTVADGGRYLLLELPENILINIDSLTDELLSAGIKIIITHPERHRFLAMQPQILERWAAKECGVQITAGSLLGKFGTISQKAAWQILGMPVPLIVATDAHNMTSRAPCMRAAYEIICRQLGEQTARLVCIENPRRVTEGDDLQNVSVEKIKLGEHEGIRDIFKRAGHSGQNRFNY
jgi:protein-tyrosine phosphatase